MEKEHIPKTLSAFIPNIWHWKGAFGVLRVRENAGVGFDKPQYTKLKFQTYDGGDIYQGKDGKTYFIMVIASEYAAVFFE